MRRRIREADVEDERGNIVVSPGLKVRHKKSQYEYTVDSVVQEPNGQITIMLAAPEAPRFGADKRKNVLSDERAGSVLYETEPVEDMGAEYYIPDDDEQSDEDLLAVPAKEFEKDYEVK